MYGAAYRGLERLAIIDFDVRRILQVAVQCLVNPVEQAGSHCKKVSLVVVYGVHGFFERNL